MSNYLKCSQMRSQLGSGSRIYAGLTGTEIALIVAAVIQTPFLMKTPCRTIVETVISISVSEQER